MKSPAAMSTDDARVRACHGAYLAAKLIASRVATNRVETRITVLAASGDGASIHAAARDQLRDCAANPEGATAHRQNQFVAVG